MNHVGSTVRKEMVVRALPEEAWAACADPLQAAQWLPDTASGSAVSGGELTWGFKHFDWSVPMRVVDADPGRHLVLETQAPDRPVSIQELTFEDAGGGDTVVSVAHSGFADGPEGQEEMAACASGWDLAFATLAVWLERYRGRPRTHLMAMESVAGAIPDDILLAFYATSIGLGSWLADKVEQPKAELAEGNPIRLHLPGERKLSGSVLALTEREVLVGWDEISGVLGLRNFAKAGQRMVALDLSAWALPAAEVNDYQELLEDRLARLIAQLAQAAAEDK